MFQKYSKLEREHVFIPETSVKELTHFRLTMRDFFNVYANVQRNETYASVIHYYITTEFGNEGVVCQLPGGANPLIGLSPGGEGYSLIWAI